MRIISTTTSIALGFAFIISSAVLASQFFGLFPDKSAVVADQRLHLAHVVAAQCSAAADTNNVDVIRSALSSLVSNNPETLSAAIRAPDGKLLVVAGPHTVLWKNGDIAPERGQEISVPIYQNNDLWATVELHYAPLTEIAWFSPILRVTLFVAASGFLGSLMFLKKALKHLDPSSVIPDRVRAMLDALAEGVIIMDNSEQVVMANEAFCRISATTLEKIQGRKLSDMQWLTDEKGDSTERLSWLRSIKEGVAVRRQTVRVHPTGTKEGEHRSLVINAVSILGTNGARRGILATFDDVTTVEAANNQLREAMNELGKSRDEIARKNLELEVLASRDPLTGCFNRRAFLRSFEDCWSKATVSKQPLACIMLDIDHFKQVNDQYGHSVGDHVLRQMGQLLQSLSRSEDMVCRYGGEEFCVLLPETSFEDGHQVAERMRRQVESAQWPVTVVTASFGVSATEAGATDIRQLLDQADKSLYAAKRTGRNRVVPWGDPVIEDASAQPTDERRGGNTVPQLRQISRALFEALRQRDPSTAEHSQRVANLVWTVAESLCTPQEAEILRMGALLHDIGKLAIPDSILKKPGPLTREEWEVMRQHESLGADLVEQATGSAELTTLVRYHHAWFGGTPHATDLPTGARIPKVCRILLIADAYDALISDRCYRKGTSHEKACVELRRCAGTQFDPELVEEFIAQVHQAPAIENKVEQLQLQYTSRCVEKLIAEIEGITGDIASAQPAATPASADTVHPASGCSHSTGPQS